ncbi:DUF3592 domain-containing protein [Altererythrobacter lutimaris]|uniref:DUF3592 domain-containing protein n=1 Tax=Altererythrobacter lutimaris TaxID=2743979 RepID=A0A850HDA5_9SPHN|nr:DUF3592 domain-containing protein [Altererythrobacter lutimaris]NVE95081.1 DUF3592 domain-containing protein [Altererythrobacter lutimaris]
MSKSLAKFGLFFAAFGMVFVSIAGFFVFRDYQVATNGLRAQGEVIALERSYDSDGDATYAPVFTFTDVRGTRHEVTGSVKSSPAAFSRGEQVEVIYDPAKPGKAIIDSFSQRYLFPLVFGGIGGVFALIGGWFVIGYQRRKATIESLKQRGMRIEAKVKRCYRDTSVTINGRSPYKVTAQATHPATGKLASFTSDAIWVDLSDQLQGGTVPVLVDPAKPRVHWIDLTEWVHETERA